MRLRSYFDVLSWAVAAAETAETPTPPPPPKSAFSPFSALFLTISSSFCQSLFLVRLFIGHFFPLLCSTHLSQRWPLCFPFLSFLSLPVCGVELADALPFLAERGGCASALDFTSSCSASCTGDRWKAASNFGKARFLPDSCSQINYSHSKCDSCCSNSGLWTLKIQAY